MSDVIVPVIPSATGGNQVVSDIESLVSVLDRLQRFMPGKAGDVLRRAETFLQGAEKYPVLLDILAAVETAIVTGKLPNVQQLILDILAKAK